MKHILIALAMLAMLRLAVPGQTVAFSSCKGEVPSGSADFSYWLRRLLACLPPFRESLDGLHQRN